VADLVTHLCTALLPGVLLTAPRATWLALGAVAPDFAARVPGLALDILRRLSVPIPGNIESPLAVFHMPIGIVCGAVIVAQVVHPKQRRQALLWLVAGGILHLAVDILQDHHGHGYFLLFPFSTHRYELGWIGSEATVAWAPFLALVTAAVWGVRWAWRRQIARSGRAIRK
jgi:hypothetical protein